MTTLTAIFRHVPIWFIVAIVVATVGSAVVAQNNNTNQPNANQQNAANPGDDAAANMTQQLRDEEMSFLELLMKGEWFMIPLALCSIVGVTLIIERAMALRRSKIMPSSFFPQLQSVFKGPDDREAALQYCRSHSIPIARVIAVGIRKMHLGVETVEQGIEDAGANEVAKLRRNFKLMFGVASIAPMIGLLGTVWGMIIAFETAAIEGFGGGKGAQSMAEGIYAALVTTFVGLAVAIPILVFYYYFQGKIESIVTELNDASEEFVEQYITDDSLPSIPPTHQAVAPPVAAVPPAPPTLTPHPAS